MVTARNRSFKNVCVEGDHKLVIEVVEGRFQIPRQLRSIIRDIRSLASSFQNISWYHIFLEASFLADIITSLGIGVFDTCVWDRALPIYAPWF